MPTPLRRPSRSRRVGAALVVAFAAIALAGCANDAPTPSPEPTASATPTVPPSFVPGGTAEQNKPWFDHVNQETLTANPVATSHEFVDGLAAGGFDKAAMEVTFDRTNVDLEADYIIVSVKIGEECLIGQRGPRGYTSEIVPPISTGTCLIGATQPITW